MAPGIRRAKSDQIKRRLKDLETENQRLGKAIVDLTLNKLMLQEAARGRRRACVERIILSLTVSERRACRALGQHRSTQRKMRRGRNDEETLTADLASWAAAPPTEPEEEEELAQRTPFPRLSRKRSARRRKA